MNSNISQNKIAIVGASCRFPGNINNLDDYWHVLANGIDVVTEVPDSRWDKKIFFHKNKKGRSYTYAAGVINDIFKFEPEFFGISRREAAQIDPQQRILLELVWEAFENAGIKISTVAKTNCGVFIGASWFDYTLRDSDNLEVLDAYSMLGGTSSICANRISYVFDFQGPSFAVDTACSSSLVALHQACNSIRSGESSMAVVGGINLLMHPLGFGGFSQAKMLSPDGKCKAFDASANGYVRSEGGGIVLLKNLDQAITDGDQILAVINASGINSDGKTNGLAHPNIEAQKNLLKKIYTNLKIDCNNIDYIEAHGTGTTVGDMVETSAIYEAITSKRDQPLIIGSSKTNLGHLELASGMAGLLKGILCIRNRAIPKSLHFNTPNPEIKFADWKINVANHIIPLTNKDKNILIGINSFGFGGANAHVLIEEYANNKLKIQNKIASDSPIPPLLISAKTEESLKALAVDYAKIISINPENYSDIAYSAYKYRENLEFRLGVFLKTTDEVIDKLNSYSDSSSTSTTIIQKNLSTPSKIAFIYSGNGSQWVGMGCDLFEHNKVFKQSILETDKYWIKLAKFSLVDELLAKDPERLKLTEVAQPLLFVIQVAITKVFFELNLRPVSVCGHSAGEVAAAYASGALSLKTAVKIIYERSFLQGVTKGIGAMAAVSASKDVMKEKLKKLKLSKYIDIAGINASKSLTISGDRDKIHALQKHLKTDHIVSKLLDIDYAFHSHHMDALKDSLYQKLAKVKGNKTDEIRFISTVSGNEVCGSQLNVDYWWQNLRNTVNFDAALSHLIANDCNVFIEIGPNPILIRYIKESLQDKSCEGVTISSLKRNAKNLAILDESFLQAKLTEKNPNFDDFFPKVKTFTQLPLYRWSKEEFKRHLENLDFIPLVERRFEHQLLGYKMRSTEFCWYNSLDLETVSWAMDHKVGGTPVFPATAYIEMALSAAKLSGKREVVELVDLEIYEPIVLQADLAKNIISHLYNDGTFIIKNQEHVTNTVKARIIPANASIVHKFDKLKLGDYINDNNVIVAKEHYNLTNNLGLSYSNTFKTVDKIYLQQSNNKALVELDSGKCAEISDDSFLIHPAILDGCFQALADIIFKMNIFITPTAMLPVSVGRIKYFGSSIASYCEIEVIKINKTGAKACFRLYDKECNLLMILDNARFKAVDLNITHVLPKTYKFIAKPQVPNISEHNATFIPKNNLIIKRVISELKKVAAVKDRAEYLTEIIPLTEALISAYYFETLQLIFANRSQITRKELQKDQNTLSFWGIIEEAIKVGIEDGWLDENKKSIKLKQVEMLSSVDIWNTLLRDYPKYLPELTLLSHIGQNLTAILMGQLSSLKVIAEKSDAKLEHLFNSSQSFIMVNKITEIVCSLLQEQAPAEKRPLRILEIGNGYANYTIELVNKLDSGFCEYVLIDNDEDNIAYLQSMCKNLDSFTAIKNNVFECSETLINSLQFQSFDIVIVNKVLHRFHDLEKVLTYIKRFLLSSGLLIIEELGANRFNNFICGTMPNWWYQNEEKYFSCLIKPDSWQEILTKSGYHDCCQILNLVESKNSNAQLILAKNGATDNVLKPLNHASKYLFITDKSKDCQNLYRKIKEELSKNKLNYIEFMIDDKKNDQVKDFITSDIQVIYLARINFTKSIDLLPDRANKRVFEIIQLVKELNNCINANLTIVTHGGANFEHGYDDYINNPVDAALWGSVRVIMNEYPKLKTRLIDLVPNNEISVMALNLFNEITIKSNETEVILNSINRQVLRLEKYDKNTKTKKSNYCLSFTRPGVLNNLCWKQIDYLPELLNDDIIVKPTVVGLNFRDVMYAMGMLSDEAVENGFAGATLGMELSGVVEKVGNKNGKFKVGDNVICFAPRSFSNKVITKTYATVHKPSKWSFQEASTIPSTFFTVYYALHYLARLEPGEKVLIHGAAGGVGLAAIQYANYIGAEIFATAGNDEKRDFIRQMGVKHVFDSRSVTFANQIMELTDNQGIDVVLNSISGEAIWQNLSILKPFGRFLELGKRDFYENSKIGLKPFRNNISYFGIDADQLLVERKDLAEKLFKELMIIFEAGNLQPLPYREFLPEDIVPAFRYMQQSKQIGKIVINFTDNFVPGKTMAEEIEQQKLPLSSKFSYLVTGGTSGFGLKTVEWLIANGAKQLILLSRSGVKNKEDQDLIDKFRNKKIDINIHTVDVGASNETKDFFIMIKKNYLPLKGIFHAAALIEDSLLQNLDEKKLESVMYPKVSGAYNLHMETLKLNLDYFVVFSSFATFLGNVGQASYAAANSYLESLVYYRRNLGLNATFAAFGAIADAGFLTRNTKVKNLLETQTGALAIKADDALDELKNLLITNDKGAAIINFEWHKIKKYMPESSSPKYSQQQKQIEDLDDENDSGNLKDILLELSQIEAVAMIIKVISHDIGSILHVMPSKLDLNKSVFDLGMDSLMAVELSMLVEKKFAIQIPLMMLSEGATINKLANNILELIKNNNSSNDKSNVNDVDFINTLSAKHASGLELDQELIKQISNEIA